MAARSSISKHWLARWRLTRIISGVQPWYCPTNLDIDKFQDSTEVLAILGVLEWGFSFGVSQLCKNSCLNCLFWIVVVPIFCGQDNLLGGQFWAMGRLNLLGAQTNLLGGQMPTQLTYYLPPWFGPSRLLRQRTRRAWPSHFFNSRGLYVPKTKSH